MPKGAAQAEAMLLCGRLGHGLRDAAFRPDGRIDFGTVQIGINQGLSVATTRHLPSVSPLPQSAAMAAAHWRRDRTSICFSCLPWKQTAWGEQVIEYILYMLWDLGLKVGHATRSLDDCMRMAKSDITVRTAILEARLILGDSRLFDTLMKRFDLEVVKGTGTEFIHAKLAERDQRHARQGESRYLVEPNIKEGKGGLRDLQTLFWISKYYYRVHTGEELVGKGVFHS